MLKWWVEQVASFDFRNDGQDIGLESRLYCGGRIEVGLLPSKAKDWPSLTKFQYAIRLECMAHSCSKWRRRRRSPSRITPEARILPDLTEGEHPRISYSSSQGLYYIMLYSLIYPCFLINSPTHGSSTMDVWTYLMDHTSTSQAGTLDDLLTLSEELPKTDGFFTSAVAKVVDTLRNLLNNDPARLEQHILVNEQSCEEYLLKGWRWNSGKYGINRSLRDIIDTLNKVLLSAF